MTSPENKANYDEVVLVFVVVAEFVVVMLEVVDAVHILVVVLIFSVDNFGFSKISSETDHIM